jgi:hypothetical protein
MRALFALVIFGVFGAASCGTTGSVPADDSGNMTDSSGHVANCQPTCSTAADCGAPGDPLYDSTHFACQAGICTWLGCRAASECTTSAHGGKFLCKAEAPGQPPSCMSACQHPADCVPAGASVVGLNDASHFACNAGACEWLGCRSQAECVSATGTSQVACERPAGAPASTCVPTCSTASDCAMQGGGTLSDANHYACKSGRCQWLGCKSTAECRMALASSRYVCE